MKKIKKAIEDIQSALKQINEIEQEELTRLNNVTDESYPEEDDIRIVLDDLREMKEHCESMLETLGYYEDGLYYDFPDDDGDAPERTKSKDEILPEVSERLYAIYERASGWITGENKNDREPDIISDAADIYVCYSEYLEKFLKEVMPEDYKSVSDAIDVIARCYPFVNRDFDREVTFEKYCNMGAELVEELSGFLGAFFDD